MSSRVCCGVAVWAAFVALGGCNALLDISEHQRASGGSAGDENDGGSEAGGPRGGSGGEPDAQDGGVGGEAGASDSAGGGAGPEDGGAGAGGISEPGAGAAGAPPEPPSEGGTAGTAGASGGSSAGGSPSGGAPSECRTGEEKRCDAEGKRQLCETGSWSDGVECDGYCSNGDCVVPPSCDGDGAGVSRCGPDDELCCKSHYVPGTRGGETFYRSYDGTSEGYEAKSAPATVSGFLLDRYEVTVGRFRRFIESSQAGGSIPDDGAGKHQHLEGGALHDTVSGDAEHGWRAAWNQYLSLSRESPGVGGTDCPTNNRTWTPAPGANEDQPIVCANWFEAYAFCIWDGGFLPSELEWNYAAAGGAQQRVYPWSQPAGSSTIECEVHAHFGQNADRCPGEDRPAPVGSYPAGAGRWKHLDLAGNVGEWTLDVGGSYVSPCADCAALGAAAGVDRVVRGGTFYNPEAFLLSSRRNPWPADPVFVPEPMPGEDDLKTYRSFDGGFRCARSPRE